MSNLATLNSVHIDTKYFQILNLDIARALTVSASMLCAEGGVCSRGGVPGQQGGTWSGGVPGPGGCTWSRGVYLV